jgi:AraC-like DNA-binding protein
MDALSEILQVIRLNSAIFLNGEFSDPWRMIEPDSAGLARIFSEGTAHIIIYHLVAEGRAYAELPDGERMVLNAGDLVTFPHGNSHFIGGGRNTPAVDAGVEISGVLQKGLSLLKFGGGGSCSRFICGYLACDPLLSPSLLGGLPPILKVNIREGPTGEWLEQSLKLSVNESLRRAPGAAAMLAKVSEAIFAETLRRYVQSLPVGEIGWFAAARDVEVGRALALLHRRPAHAWGVNELAREVGTSRTVLSQRFTHFLGEPPMTYLTRWRLRLGARALTGTRRSVSQIAADVGYESEAAFNRAFKREYGQPPARYRKSKASR